MKLDPNAIASSLTQLTSGWTPGPGVNPQALTAAREALASSLIAGKSLAEIHAAQPQVTAQPPSDPQLTADLLQLASSVASAQAPGTVAIIRSAYAATGSANPARAPAWARGAQILQSFGPFLDLNGIPHWVDLALFTISTQFAFGTATSPFGVFPIVHFLIPPASATEFNLGSGSVWFLANWLQSALPSGAFTGFSIIGGTLNSSKAMTYTRAVCTLCPPPPN